MKQVENSPSEKLPNRKHNYSIEKIMTTHFITAEIDLQESPAALQKEIEAELQKRGEPLRWAVTEVDGDRQKAIVEAVVTVPAPQRAN
jgi:ribosomal protein S6